MRESSGSFSDSDDCAMQWTVLSDSEMVEGGGEREGYLHELSLCVLWRDLAMFSLLFPSSHRVVRC